jgi:hypothetical protein
MTTTEAPRAVKAPIYWAVIRSIGSVADADAYAASATPITDRPATGTITLINGAKRRAEWMIGSLTGMRRLQYMTPAGRWKNPLPAEIATFRPDGA